MKIYLIIIIFLSFCYIHNVTSLTIESEENEKEPVRPSMEFVSTKVQIPVANVEEGAKLRKTINYETAPGEPIQIQKIISPGNRKCYLKGDLLRISVEIKGLEEVNGVKIQEFINDDIGLVNISNYCYKIYTFKEIENFRDDKYLGCDLETHGRNTISFGEDKIYSINCQSGTAFFYFDDIIDKNNVTKREKDNITYLIKNTTGNEIKDDFDILIKDYCTITLRNSKGLNCSIGIDERNKSAFLKYDNLIYKLKAEREQNHTIPIDSATGKFQNLICVGKLRISNLDNDFSMYIDSLDPQERLIYWYYINPKKITDISTITTLRIYGNNKPNYRDVDYSCVDYPDIDYPLNIEISAPTYKVAATFDNYKLFNNEKLKVVYDIGIEDAVTDSLFNTSIKLDETNKFNMYNVSNPNEEIKNTIKYIQLNKDHNGANITYLISFPESGACSLPGVWIDDKLYPFEKTIEVTTKFDYSMQWATIIAVLIGIVLGEIYGPLIMANRFPLRVIIAIGFFVILIIFYIHWVTS